jgi:Uma2 family endonuclease
MTQGDYHISCINRLNRILSRVCGDDVIVSVQNAVVISNISEPEPDVALLKFREDFYASGKATAADVLLLIEVSDSTVGYDRTVKARLYAEAEVAEFWLVNLPRQILEVYTEPQNGKYKVVKKYEKNKTVSPALLPEIKIKFRILSDNSSLNPLDVFASLFCSINKFLFVRQSQHFSGRF